MATSKPIAVYTTVAHKQSRVCLLALDGLFEEGVEVFSQVQTIDEIQCCQLGRARGRKYWKTAAA